MAQWFSQQSDHHFQAFSTSHLIVLIVAVTGFLIMFLTYKNWPDHPVIHQIIRWVFFILLLLSEVSYQIWAHYHNVWSFRYHTPLHLCGIASIIAMLALLFKKKLFIQLAFFFGVIPAFLTLITPDLIYDYQHYRFWKFFVHHLAISWSCMFVALSKPQSITFPSALISYAFLLGYAALIGFVVNPMIDANYLYLTQQPNANTLLNFFGEGIFYYINLVSIAFFLFLFQYLIWRLLIKKDNGRVGVDMFS